jgi:chromosome partitioning protein
VSVQSDLDRYHGPYPNIFAALPKAERAQLLDLFELIARLPAGYRFALAVGNLKGGVGKTTSSIYIALMLALAGRVVLLVDSDGTNQTAYKWAQIPTDWPTQHLKVRAWGAKDNRGGDGLIGVKPAEMDAKIAEALTLVDATTGAPAIDDLVVDIGPQREAYLRRALKHCTDFIVLSGQYTADTEQIAEAVDLAREVAEESDHEIFTTVLFTRVNKRATSFAEALAELDAAEVSYFGEVIPTKDHYGLANTHVPNQFGEYIAVLRQLVEAHLDSLGIAYPEAVA